jgi:hypothetical protein
MPGSYLSVPYPIRPAKGVERRMFAEAVRRLAQFGPLDGYRYIGFGSPFFADFTLFHRSLGIKRMVNIEVREKDAARFRFNRPFSCVKLVFGDSTTILDRVGGWSRRTVLWLDYDGRMDTSVLEDVRVVATNASSGSVFLITVNAQPVTGKDPADTDSKRLEEASRLAAVPVASLSVRPEDLGGTGTATYFRSLIQDRLQLTLNSRNSGLSKDDPKRIEYRQLFYFLYADGPQMLSVGGVLYARRDEKKLDRAGLDRNTLGFIRTGEEPCDIEVPPLTVHEVHHLNAQLPLRSGRALTARGIPKGHLDRFKDIYRYYPTYVLAEA